MLDWHNNPCPIDFTRMVRVGGRNIAVIHGLGTGPPGVGT
jgi:hypothetical protein